MIIIVLFLNPGHGIPSEITEGPFRRMIHARLHPARGSKKTIGPGRRVLLLLLLNIAPAATAVVLRLMLRLLVLLLLLQLLKWRDKPERTIQDFRVDG